MCIRFIWCQRLDGPCISCQAVFYGDICQGPVSIIHHLDLIGNHITILRLRQRFCIHASYGKDFLFHRKARRRTLCRCSCCCLCRIRLLLGIRIFCCCHCCIYNLTFCQVLFCYHIRSLKGSFVSLFEHAVDDPCMLAGMSGKSIFHLRFYQ